MSDFEYLVWKIAGENPESVSLGKWREIIAQARRVVEENPLMEEGD